MRTLYISAPEHRAAALQLVRGIPFTLHPDRAMIVGGAALRLFLGIAQPPEADRDIAFEFAEVLDEAVQMLRASGWTRELDAIIAPDAVARSSYTEIPQLVQNVCGRWTHPSYAPLDLIASRFGIETVLNAFDIRAASIATDGDVLRFPDDTRDDLVNHRRRLSVRRETTATRIRKYLTDFGLTTGLLQLDCILKTYDTVPGWCRADITRAEALGFSPPKTAAAATLLPEEPL